MKLICSSVLYFCFMCYALTQDNVHVQQVHSLFPGNSKAIWIKSYRGTSSTGSEILFILGNDGKDYKGIYQRFPEGSKHLVEGLVDKQNIKLIELDSQLEVTHFCYGSIQDSLLDIRILNKNAEQGEYFYLKRLYADVNVAANCGDMSWLRTYKGTYSGDFAEVSLQKDENQVFGWLRLVTYKQIFYLKGYCNDPACLTGNVDIRKLNSELAGEAFFNFFPNDSIALKINLKKQKQIQAELKLEQSYKVYCKSGGKPGKKYWYSYIQTGDKNFDRWIQNECTIWADQILSFQPAIGDYKGINGSAYMDLDWISPDFISGSYKYYEPWSEENRKKAFIYDRKSKDIIMLHDLFVREFNYQDFILQRKEEIKTTMTSPTNKHFNEWLRVEQFPYVTFRPEGLSFSSHFSEYFGEIRITIAYEELKEYFKKIYVQRLDL